MHPIAVLMLSEALEEERRRVQRHPRRWVNLEPPHGAARESGTFRLARIFGLATSKA